MQDAFPAVRRSPMKFGWTDKQIHAASLPRLMVILLVVQFWNLLNFTAPYS